MPREGSQLSVPAFQQQQQRMHLRDAGGNSKAFVLSGPFLFSLFGSLLLAAGRAGQGVRLIGLVIVSEGIPVHPHLIDDYSC